MYVGICLDLLHQYKQSKTQGFSFSNEEYQETGNQLF
jgi:hypothetical protein